MSTLTFYQEQATLQQIAADAATLQNVRDRCQRAADAWAKLAARRERIDTAREESVRAAQLVQDAPGG